MAKDKIAYVCSNCGQESAKWIGKCPNCGQWNTFKEIRVAAETAGQASAASAASSVRRGRNPGGSRPLPLRSISAKDEPRIDMRDGELNRVLGGGLVPGSIVLLGGEPGIGKSTLTLQTILNLHDRKILYVSGEESAHQLKMRAERIYLADKQTSRQADEPFLADKKTRRQEDGPFLADKQTSRQVDEPFWENGQTSRRADGQVIGHSEGGRGDTHVCSAARSLPAGEDNCLILCDTSLESIFANIQETHPDIVVIDSIQTISTESVDSSPGSVTQVRECASALLRFAKSSGVPVILIGHINKEGTLAGPKILEHIVDTVIQFEGDQHYMYRILRSTKNRFGSTSELGIYEMRQDGLRQVSNPSELLLSQDHEGLSGVAISSAIEGVRPFLVETQALVSTAAYGTPQRSATGFDQRRLNMLLAVLEKRVGFKLVQKDVFLNIAGGLRVTDMAMDLSVIAAVLSSNVDTAIEGGWCMAGEVGLSGEVRPVSRIEQRISEAEKLGFTHIIVPKHNLQGLSRKKFNIELVPVRKVDEALRALFG